MRFDGDEMTADPDDGDAGHFSGTYIQYATPRFAEQSLLAPETPAGPQQQDHDAHHDSEVEGQDEQSTDDIQMGVIEVRQDPRQDHSIASTRYQPKKVSRTPAICLRRETSIRESALGTYPLRRSPDPYMRPGPASRRRRLPAMRPDELERRLRERLDALWPAPRAELLHVLMLPDFECADRIGEFWSYPESPNLRRAADRLRGGPDAEGGTRRDVAGSALGLLETAPRRRKMAARIGNSRSSRDRSVDERDRPVQRGGTRRRRRLLPPSSSRRSSRPRKISSTGRSAS